jgi:parallel beta-helix repeat protein
MNIARRSFFRWSAGLGLATVLGRRSPAGEPPPVTQPRATDGDERFEPKWDERLQLTVGREKADLMGADDKVIQAAVDYVARLGGGTVRLLPGVFTLRNAVCLPSHVRLAGSGPDSLITKIASVTVPISADSDWYDQEVTLADGGGFQVGDGVVLRATNPHNGSQQVIKRTIVARSGNRFKLNNGLRENLWLSGKPTCSLMFPLLTSEYTSDVVVEHLALDGNRDNSPHLDGNYGGCVFLQDCNRYTFRSVEARNYFGDGISFQICHDMLVENCHCHDNADLGVHPGSGSQRPVLRGNRLDRNRIGLFWCWGVKYGLAEDNQIASNRDFGISIGHNDTDNVMRNNTIRDSGKVGVLFRDENRGRDFWPNRNVLEQNVVEDSGGEEGIAVDVQGKTRDVRLIGNTIRETRGKARRIGVRISADARNIELSENRIDGLAQPVLQMGQ